MRWACAPVRLTLDVGGIVAGLTEAVDREVERVAARAGRFEGSKML